eukprot:UN08670
MFIKYKGIIGYFFMRIIHYIIYRFIINWFIIIIFHMWCFIIITINNHWIDFIWFIYKRTETVCNISIFKFIQTNFIIILRLLQHGISRILHGCMTMMTTQIISCCGCLCLCLHLGCIHCKWSLYIGYYCFLYRRYWYWYCCWFGLFCSRKPINGKMSHRKLPHSFLCIILNKITIII